jgi:hypothetical protein
MVSSLVPENPLDDVLAIWVLPTPYGLRSQLWIQAPLHQARHQIRIR